MSYSNFGVLRSLYVSLVGLSLCCAGCSGEPNVSQENVDFAGVALRARDIRLTPIGRYNAGIIDADWGATEVSAYDAKTQRLFVVNVNQRRLDALDISDPTAPMLVASYATAGEPTSVATRQGLVVVSNAASNKTDPGQVHFLDAETLAPLATVAVGATPDMITFTPNGRFLLTANEGEPSDDYSVDPEGSVSIIDLRRGVRRLSQVDVTTVGFTEQVARTSPDSIRVFGRNLTYAQNLEPEYIAVSRDSSTAWVTLQENNAIATLDLRAKRFTRISGLGFKDHNVNGNGLDASDKDGVANIKPWPVYGMYEPDAIDTLELGCRTFLVTANEGDAREWGDVVEETTISALPNLDPALAELAADKTKLGRLAVSAYGGVDLDSDGDIDRPLTFGARSFSIWSSEGDLVFDSGDDFEQRILELAPTGFSSDNKSTPSFDKRSGKKGPEPEGLTVAKIRGASYAFIGLERVGGVMVYDVSIPNAPRFVTYANSRDFAATTLETAGDLGPEGILFIAEHESPNRQPLLVLSNEVSGTVTIYQIEANH